MKLTHQLQHEFQDSSLCDIGKLGWSAVIELGVILALFLSNVVSKVEDGGIVKLKAPSETDL